MASDQAAEVSKTGGSLEDRISQPDTASSGTPQASNAPTSWADEVASSTETDGAVAGAANTAQEPSIPQIDGASSAPGATNLHEPEFNVNVKLSDLQADPNNPLFSIKTFEELGLEPTILRGLTMMNFRKPSKIQERALPLLLNNPPTNMIGQSQSGTGKTAAFVLNILSRLDLSTPEMQKSPQALVLAPSRELARQIVGVIQVMGSFVEGLVVGTAVPADTNSRPSRLECSVVVGTPGTVMDQIKKRIFLTQRVKVLVLDEADNMLDLQGMGDQCIRVKQLLPKTIQVVLFSATFPVHVRRYASKFAPGANELTLEHEDLTVEGIKQLYLDCESDEDKYNVLVKLYGLLTIGSSIIFVKTRQSAQEIEKRMTAEGHTVVSLTGGVEGSKRDDTIDKFRSGEAKVLITTNVLARGIDVSTVSMVINYDIPELHDPHSRERKADPQTYLHRIGRTGRFGRVGVSISFVANREEWQMLMAIQDFFKTDITRIDTRDWDEVEEIIKKTIKNPRSHANYSQQQ
ncbi:hypothetical protein ATEG_08153 [Paecilomyces variotii No. 5]|uniref:RNA helicase n=1 Tax=Byssochlamys spectabilis (strain No. 5 / NBRC 109023) TaxID=1356009 RepID=V5HZ37_BYSSN|nr:hypothetical protein ATEG_08153 [Paecilomyces variotii No. 5]